MGKTYKHSKTERRFRKKLKKVYDQLDTKHKIDRELEDHENKKEMSEMQDSNYEENSRRDQQSPVV
jgi:hypothetical protein